MSAGKTAESSEIQHISSTSNTRIRTSYIIFSPPSADKNRYTPLSNLNENKNDSMSIAASSDKEKQQPIEVSRKVHLFMDTI